MRRAAPSQAAQLIGSLLRQECESVHHRLIQASSGRGDDAIHGVLGFRRGVKKVRGGLRLCAGGIDPRRRRALDAQWGELARRLSAFRDDDARRAAVAGVIVRLPPETRDAAQCAWNEIAGAPSGAHGADRRGVLQALVDDTERCIAATERLTLEDLTPELVAGTVRHLWRRARARAVKSWKGRDEAWLHALRKRVQQAHIALRLLRGRAGERGARLESRLDAAAKAMGSWRDLSMVRRAMDAARARGSAPPALEPLRAESLRCELEAAARARRLVRRAFQPGIGPVVRGVRCGAASP